MTKTSHKIFIFSLALIVVATLVYLYYIGISFYKVSIEERFFHPDYSTLKPSGAIGHGLGILGSFLMLLGVITYMLRKRYRVFHRFGLLKHWLEFHIFLCTLGPMLVLFHTSFKFGGIVSISFWSMVAVFLSGIVGRFIYIQIPRTIEGRELSLNEVQCLRGNIDSALNKITSLSQDSILSITELTQNLKTSADFIKTYFEDQKIIRNVKSLLTKSNTNKGDFKTVVNMVKNEISLNRKIARLVKMQNLLKYWHVAHLPFAFVMLIVMIIHVVITILFGYRWIF
ncbi:MAG: hypothetical protein A2033_03650 [Bacteroidetes bacterium GWA2_31_9]|nr:MAG: hypothetical protein A2033_03650 [Bacteroidetes bacterium GWA2_31_9]